MKWAMPWAWSTAVSGEAWGPTRTLISAAAWSMLCSTLGTVSDNNSGKSSFFFLKFFSQKHFVPRNSKANTEVNFLL